MSCLDENRVIDFIAGSLSKEMAARVEAHIDACPTCRTLLAEVAASASLAPEGRVEREL